MLATDYQTSTRLFSHYLTDNLAINSYLRDKMSVIDRLICLIV